MSLLDDATLGGGEVDRSKRNKFNAIFLRDLGELNPDELAVRELHDAVIFFI